MNYYNYLPMLVWVIVLYVGSQLIAAPSAVAQINIIADPRIEHLLQQHRNYNLNQGTVDGFRVQLIQDTKREEARSTKTDFLRMFPDVNVYESYDAPFYKVRAGDFENRFGAYRLLKLAKSTFTRAFIVEDNIYRAEME